jgi:hypothetical protein
MNPDHVPFNFNARRLSVFGKNQLREILDNLLREGVIRESNSPYASPIVLVKKKTGDLRLCIDFLTLNKQVVKDQYPLPFTDNQINKLRGMKYFTKLDLKKCLLSHQAFSRLDEVHFLCDSVWSIRISKTTFWIL